ncbi:MAG: GerMN domain-containing protein, partial [Spirochaetaceae bacterium]|nr:GerMN domain-containing protein [Spirochaetaceae bacterium]
KTKFLDIVKERTDTTKTLTTETPGDQAPAGQQTQAPSPIAPPQGSPAGSTTSVPPVQAEPSATNPPATGAPAGATEGQSGQANGGATTEMRRVSLFFMKIEDDGMISSHEVKRMIPVTDSPLTDAVKALLGGPSEGEIRSKLVSLIPKGTALRGITVRGSTAIIDLSESFMYNKYGIEGYTAQLKQIVYTATSFSSVQDVQILVEGKMKDYLGGEGVYTGKPLSRNSF